MTNQTTTYRARIRTLREELAAARLQTEIDEGAARELERGLDELDAALAPPAPRRPIALAFGRS